MMVFIQITFTAGNRGLIRADCIQEVGEREDHTFIRMLYGGESYTTAVRDSFDDVHRNIENAIR